MRASKKKDILSKRREARSVMTRGEEPLSTSTDQRMDTVVEEEERK